MKIVYIYDAIARLGGAEKVLIEKMNYLADQYGQDIYILTTCQGKHAFPFPLSKKVKHTDLNINFHIKYKYSFPRRLYIEWQTNKLFINRLKYVVNDINPDILIATTYYYADTICNLECKAKKIVESHAAKAFTGINDGTKRNVLSQIFQKRKIIKCFKTIEKKSDAIVTLTDGDSKEWNAKNIFVIPNIVDLHNQQHSKLTNKVALFAGRLSYQKGLERMLKAWKTVINIKKDWTLRIVGEGELKENLVQLCRKLEIENNVIFVPKTNNMIEEYCNSSMFLLASRYEGFGLVLVEAMQCGVPCISFDCPYGPTDIIDNDQNGILVDNGNIEKFANAILKLIDDEDLRIKMGKTAIEKAQNYLPQYIMPQWIKLFEHLTLNNHIK